MSTWPSISGTRSTPSPSEYNYTQAEVQKKLAEAESSMTAEQRRSLQEAKLQMEKDLIYGKIDRDLGIYRAYSEPHRIPVSTASTEYNYIAPTWEDVKSSWESAHTIRESAEIFSTGGDMAGFKTNADTCKPGDLLLNSKDEVWRRGDNSWSLLGFYVSSTRDHKENIATVIVNDHGKKKEYKRAGDEWFENLTIRTIDWDSFTGEENVNASDFRQEKKRVRLVGTISINTIIDVPQFDERDPAVKRDMEIRWLEYQLTKSKQSLFEKNSGAWGGEYHTESVVADTSVSDDQEDLYGTASTSAWQDWY